MSDITSIQSNLSIFLQENPLMFQYFLLLDAQDIKEWQEQRKTRNIGTSFN